MVDEAVSWEQRAELQVRPTGSALMYQRWESLLFLHWSVDPEVVQATLPPGLRVDTYDGRAYLGVVPFRMCGLRPRFLPAVGGISNFAELNLRTYVYDSQGRPGVWFYSLDANSWLSVKIAQRFFSLPYVWAKMQMRGQVDSTVELISQRPDCVRQAFRYRGRGGAQAAVMGSLEYFLSERCVLFSYDSKRGRLSLGRIYHRPYLLEDVEVDAYSSALLGLNGFVGFEAREPEHVMMSRGVAVEVFGMERVSG